jgi:hypothetical protein
LADHDNAYKLLLSFRRVMGDLLLAFVREDWILQVDLDTLEKVNASYVSDRFAGNRLQDRESDLVWRVRWKGDGRWLYIYLLLEFQSSNDSFMALRVMTYVALLQQDLVRQGALTPAGKIPPVLAIVLYNGLAAWTAAQDVADLVENVPGGLERYSPRLRYLLLDERRLAESDLASVRNVAAAVFRLEKEATLQGAEAMIDALLEWLRGPEQAELMRALGVWMSEVVLPARLPGVKVPRIADLLEVKKMIAEHAIDWTKEWKDRGREEGRAEGREEGREAGRAEALQEIRRITQETLEARFGALPPQAQEKLSALDSAEALGRLIAHSATASSLAELDLL